MLSHPSETVALSLLDHPLDKPIDRHSVASWFAEIFVNGGMALGDRQHCGANSDRSGPGFKVFCLSTGRASC